MKSWTWEHSLLISSTHLGFLWCIRTNYCDFKLLCLLINSSLLFHQIHTALQIFMYNSEKIRHSYLKACIVPQLPRNAFLQAELIQGEILWEGQGSRRWENLFTLLLIYQSSLAHGGLICFMYVCLWYLLSEFFFPRCFVALLGIFGRNDLDLTSLHWGNCDDNVLVAWLWHYFISQALFVFTNTNKQHTIWCKYIARFCHC